MPFAVWYNTYVFVLPLLPSRVYTHCPPVQQGRAGCAVSGSGDLEVTSFRPQQHVTYCFTYVLKMESGLICNCTLILCLPWESLVLKQDEDVRVGMKKRIWAWVSTPPFTSCIACAIRLCLAEIISLFRFELFLILGFMPGAFCILGKHCTMCVTTPAPVLWL